MAAVGVIDRGVLVLKQFVDGLARGEPNAPLRLYPAYRELAGLQGKAASAEKDLFFPDLTPPAPAHPRAERARCSRAARVPASAARALPARAAGWLRHQPDGIEDMREVLDAMHAAAAQLPERRALWWAATALMDGLAEAKDAEWLARAKALCNKLDFQIRDLAAGSRSANDALLREMLYAIACCSAGSQRVRQVRQTASGSSQLIPAAQAAAPDRVRCSPRSKTRARALRR